MSQNTVSQLLSKAQTFYSNHQYQEAKECCQIALQQDKRLPDAYFHLGNACRALNDLDMAMKAYFNCLQLQPKYAAAVHNNLGACYFDKNNVKLAIKSYQQAILIDAKYPDAYNNLGNALQHDNCILESIEAYKKCIALRPNASESCHSYNNLGNSYKRIDCIKEAIDCYLIAIRLSPTYSAAYSNLASLYFEQNRIDEAIIFYQNAIKFDPLFADAYSNLGNLYKALGRDNEALECYQNAVKIKPGFAEAYSNMAAVYKDKSDYLLAIQYYRQALELKPDFFDAFANLHHTLNFICDWNDWENRNQELKFLLKKQLSISSLVLPSVQPLHSILYDLNLSELHEISKRYASKVKTNVLLNEKKYFHKSKPKISGGNRLKVGYVSSDFNDHPLSSLMLSVFGMHEKSKFEIFCYALNPSDNSVYRNHITNSVEPEHFKDISSFRHDIAAELIYQDNIDILINLNGYTKGNRNEIFALKPSPIQIQYMGFCGTMGADYIDYIIADNVVIPPPPYTTSPSSSSSSSGSATTSQTTSTTGGQTTQQICIEFYSHYSEKIIAMPHSYFVNDYKQSMTYIAEAQGNTTIMSNMPCRKDYGLPENAFIFCNFNQLHKIDPDIFKTWMRILNRVPNSILWLLRFPALGEENIRKFAQEHGLIGDRLYFSDLASREQHLKRCVLANLFLDTPAYNAHTTACDTLWTGTPIISLCNNTKYIKMCSRVSASLLTACNLQELITSDTTDYENLAVALGNSFDPNYKENSNIPVNIFNNGTHGTTITNNMSGINYHDVRTRLQSCRMTCPAFDTLRWVRYLEKAFEAIWKRHESSLPPEHIQVAELSD